MLRSEAEMNAANQSATDEDCGRECGRAVRNTIRRPCGWPGTHTLLASAAASGLTPSTRILLRPFPPWQPLLPRRGRGVGLIAADAGLSTAPPVALGAGRYPI